jgi:hypothetical protein
VCRVGYADAVHSIFRFSWPAPPLSGAVLASPGAYNEIVARGWESKSIEGQIESFASERASSSKEHFTPEQIARQRQRESLLLSRTRVQRDIDQSRNPRHLKILKESLAYLDAKLAELD